MRLKFGRFCKIDRVQIIFSIRARGPHGLFNGTMLNDFPGLEIVFVEWLLNLAYPRCASMLRPLDGPRGTA